MPPDESETRTLAAPADPRVAFGAEEPTAALRDRGVGVARESSDRGTGADADAEALAEVGADLAIRVDSDGALPSEAFRIEPAPDSGPGPVRVVGGDAAVTGASVPIEMRHSRR